MTVAGKVAIFLIALGVFISGIVLLVDSSNRSPNVSYQGELIFTSDESFLEFKDFAISPKVEIQGLDITELGNFTRIKYQLKVPRDYPFPYEYASKFSTFGEGAGGFAVMIILGGAFTFAFGIFVFEKEDA